MLLWREVLVLEGLQVEGLEIVYLDRHGSTGCGVCSIGMVAGRAMTWLFTTAWSEVDGLL